MTLPDDIVERLNAYTGGNLWQDVIFEILTRAEWWGASDLSDRFVHAGVDYRYEPSQGKWVWRE